MLLTDPEHRACLAAARALGRAGYRVLTIGSRRGIAGVSRSVVRHVSVPEMAGLDNIAYVSAVREVVRNHGVDVVVPVTDSASRVLLSARDALGVAVAGPSASAYDRASDKQGAARVAALVGMRVPYQVTVQTAGEIAELEPALRWPVVIKPARSVVEVDGKLVRHSVAYAQSFQDLITRAESLPCHAYPLLLQERIVGDGVGVFLLRQQRVTMLSFAHRRLREKPPSGGVSTLRESIALDGVLLARCEALLDELEYDGAAMIELKIDRATGEAVLMEINARLWGSLQLSVDAGVDFPSALVASALGRAVPPQPEARLGVRTFWELGELDHALALLRRTREELHAPADMRVGPGAAAQALFDHHRSDKPEVFRWSDPMPFVAELYAWVRRR